MNNDNERIRYLRSEADRKEKMNRRLVKHLIVATLVVVIGFSFGVLASRSQEIIRIFIEDSATIVQYSLVSISAILAVFFVGSSATMFLSSRLNRTDPDFIDIDRARDPNAQQVSIADIRRLEKIVIDNAVDAPQKLKELQELQEKQLAKNLQADKNLTKTFENYFNGIRKTLEEKSSLADEKASVLLDKGTQYSRMGIWFFVFSIVAWQLIAYLTGFKTQYIYGIASCSALFIFIEFLSAWFLRQYRQFIDTSTYLIKVKSIFDRYMLAYLLVKDIESENNDEKKMVFDLLKAEIKWPETYLMKNPDINFAKEALESITVLVKQIKEKD